MIHSMKHYLYRGSERGMGIVEAVVVIAIASAAFGAILGSAVFFLRGGMANADRVQAAYLLDEGVEALRFLRDEGYTANILPLVGTTFDVGAVPTGYVATSTGALHLGAFTRTISMEAVHRRTSDDIIVPAGSADPHTLDPGTVAVSVTVTWPRGIPITATTYISDIHEN